MLLNLDAVEVAVVLCELGLVHAGTHVAEECIGLIFFQLDIDIAGTGGFVLLVGGIPVERVVGVRVDDLVQAIAVEVLLVGVVGHGQEPLALDRALGEELHSAVIVVVFVDAGFFQADLVAGEVIVANCSFRETDQDPVARGGFEPLSNFVTAIGKLYSENCFSGRRCRRQFQ